MSKPLRGLAILGALAGIAIGAASMRPEAKRDLAAIPVGDIRGDSARQLLAQAPALFDDRFFHKRADFERTYGFFVSLTRQVIEGNIDLNRKVLSDTLAHFQSIKKGLQIIEEIDSVLIVQAQYARTHFTPENLDYLSSDYMELLRHRPSWYSEYIEAVRLLVDETAILRSKSLGAVFLSDLADERMKIIKTYLDHLEAVQARRARPLDCLQSELGSWQEVYNILALLKRIASQP